MSGAARVRANDFSRLWELVQTDALAALSRVGRRGWYILGEEGVAFERALGAAWAGLEVVGCASGLDAIELGLRALGLRPGERVLTTPLSAFATTLAIVRAGGIPCFVDVDASGLLDLDLVEVALAADRELRWLLPVHLYGHALDLRRLADLRRRFDLRIVEDCAQSIGARSAEAQTGTVGDAAATSFYPTKNLGAFGDGGALLTGSPEIARRARVLRDYGQTRKYEHDELGMNSRLDEVQAAILRDALLPRLAGFTTRRQAIAARYLAELGNPAIEPLPIPAGSTSVWHLFPVLCRDGALPLAAHLAAHGIDSAQHYPRLIPAQGALAGTPFQVLSRLPRAEAIAARELSLPIHPLLTDDEVARVVEACRGYHG